MPNQDSSFESLLEEARSSTMSSTHSKQNRTLRRVNAILWAIWFLMMVAVWFKNLSLADFDLGLFTLLVFGGLIIFPFMLALFVGCFASVLAIIPIKKGWTFETRFVRIFWILAIVVQAILILFLVSISFGNF